jgi:poly [ADP-ribose] polymerase
MNVISNSADFVTHSAKYTFVHIDYTQPADQPADDDDGEDGDSKEAKDAPSSKLDTRVQTLVELIYDKKMMEKQMVEMDFDVKKMPLGRLAQTQIDKGYETLKEMAELIEEGKASGTCTV